jgi:2-polyprenyl-6-methoxyphenol hydroxylase-like FAD-dependent oxidoreductase
MSGTRKTLDADVVVVGAGPCGTFLAHLLGRTGLSCLVLDKRTTGPVSSMAIGVMPPSLYRLDHVGLATPLVEAGCPVQTARVLSEGDLLGTLDLSRLPGRFNFILSVPESILVGILRHALGDLPRVTLRVGQEVTAVHQTTDGVLVETRDATTGQGSTVTARYAAGCDGHRSAIRASLGLSSEGRSYAPSFVMGDFPESTPWNAEARLFFTPAGSLESFPLPHARRRWVAQVDPAQATLTTLVQRVQAVTGHFLDAAHAASVTSFTPERRLCRRYFEGRVLLCGDAAHVMSPIGGQGMNTGFGDAWHAAAVLQRLCSTGERPEPLLRRYDSCRRRAFRVAANRAERGMWLGTRRGRVTSLCRAAFIRHGLFGTVLRHRLAAYFTMLTIPDEAPLAGLTSPEAPRHDA